MTRWIQYIYLNEIVKRIYDVYTVQKQKAQAAQKQQIIFSKIKFLMHFRKKVKYVGNLDDRLLRRAKQSLNVKAIMTKENFEERGTRLLRAFLFQTNLNLQAKDHFNHVNDMRYKVADMYRRHLNALKGRVDAMRIVFQNQANYLQAFYSKKKKGVTIKKH